MEGKKILVNKIISTGKNVLLIFKSKFTFYESYKNIQEFFCIHHYAFWLMIYDLWGSECGKK